jgi:hypothetical protein
MPHAFCTISHEHLYAVIQYQSWSESGMDAEEFRFAEIPCKKIKDLTQQY